MELPKIHTWPSEKPDESPLFKSSLACDSACLNGKSASAGCLCSNFQFHSLQTAKQKQVFVQSATELCIFNLL